MVSFLRSPASNCHPSALYVDVISGKWLFLNLLHPTHPSLGHVGSHRCWTLLLLFLTFRSLSLPDNQSVSLTSLCLMCAETVYLDHRCIHSAFHGVWDIVDVQ